MKYMKGTDNVKAWATTTPPSSSAVWDAIPHKTDGYALAVYRHGHGWKITAVPDIEFAVKDCEVLRDMCELYPEVVGQWHEYSDMVVFATAGTDHRNLHTNWYACGIIVED